MANQNIEVPRFYTDLISYHQARGSNIGAVTATNANNGFIGVQTGSVEELFDLRPFNQVTFDTSEDTNGHVLVNIGFTTASYRQNYISILNHNLATAKCKIRIFAGNASSDIVSLNGAGIDVTDPDTDAEWNNITTTEVVNADNINVASGNRSIVIEPSADGTTIIKFTEKNLRFWAIQFEGSQTSGGAINQGSGGTNLWGTTDLRVGGIMVGEYFDMPHALDINLTRSIDYDHVNVQESLGGQRYATSTSLGRTVTATSKSSFQLGTYDQLKYGGRQVYNLNFSYLDATDVLPNEYNTYQNGNDSVISDVWNLVDGPSRPFIFSIDNTSTGANAESEHIFARFDQSSLSMVQNSVSTYNISLKISEEF